MLIEDQRFLHEDLERLEQAIADRVAEDPRNIKDRLNRDHQVNGFLTRIQEQSKRLLDIYKDSKLIQEKQALSTGEPFELFFKQFEDIKDFHRRYPNEQVENLERAYRRKQPVEGEQIVTEIDNMFTGEEGNGRFLDMTTQHEAYLNLPGIKRPTYIQYLDIFDAFEPPRMPLKPHSKISDTYLEYVRNLGGYLESFIRRTRPLDDLQKLFTKIDREFESDWEGGKVPGWTKADPASTHSSEPQTEGTGEGIWCPDCAKEFAKDSVYRAHLSGKKHIKNAEARKASGGNPSQSLTDNTNSQSTTQLKQRVVASHEHRVRALADLLSNERSNTRVNVERKQGMTERERQTELDALFKEDDDAIAASSGAHNNPDDSGSDSDDEEKIHNPLKLPLAWDGKPIPYWLYKLHGLGVEFPCEICGNFVYMGRRAFDKHFSEARHVYGLKCLGITSAGAGSGGSSGIQTSLFREITGIEEAVALWDKLRREKREKEQRDEGVVQMEDGEGNVMPERIYLDLQKQGIL